MTGSGGIGADCASLLVPAIASCNTRPAFCTGAGRAHWDAGKLLLYFRIHQLFRL